MKLNITPYCISYLYCGKCDEGDGVEGGVLYIGVVVYIFDPLSDT